MQPTTITDGLVTPPPLPLPPPVDPTEALLDAPAGRLLESRVGDVCSLLGIVGAATIAISRRSPAIEHVGVRIVSGSMVAGGADTAIQARNVVVDAGAGAERRGNERSDAGSIAYAATGMIPAASIAALRGLAPHAPQRDVLGMALLAVNTAVLGYELVTRTPGIMRGQEDLSGYGSLLASLGGFVVARHLVLR